jgi:hypothetical protein
VEVTAAAFLIVEVVTTMIGNEHSSKDLFNTACIGDTVINIIA